MVSTHGSGEQLSVAICRWSSCSWSLESESTSPTTRKWPRQPLIRQQAAAILKWCAGYWIMVPKSITLTREARYCPALTYAAYEGHIDVLKLLVERGADIHASWMCMNALMHAQDYGQQEVVKYLRSLGVKDLRETTPPDYVAAHRLIINHLTEQLGPLSKWQADILGSPAVTIRSIAANEQCPTEQTLFTVGLSDRRLPAEWGEFACGELKLTLPAEWPLSESAQTESDWNWPIEWLKRIVMELREGDRWPAAPVMFPNGSPPAPFNSETKLCCWLCLLSQGGSIQVPDCRWIDFHGLFPIYEEEMQLVRERGHEALVYRFQARDLPNYVDPSRPNVAWDPDPQS